jgi:hypothetical protein
LLWEYCNYWCSLLTNFCSSSVPNTSHCLQSSIARCQL